MTKRSAAQPFDVKHYNYSSIYHAIYHARRITKKELASQLHLSLPTVSQDLAELMEKGLVAHVGHSSSTGGRKPGVLGPVPTARVAAGLEVIHEFARLVVIDLYGTLLLEEQLPVPFAKTPAYFDALCRWAEGLLRPYSGEQLLGVGIAIQGILSPDRTQVSYAQLLEPGITLAEFQTRLPWPCCLIHDVEAAARAEIWFWQDVDDAIYLLLNRNIGGALIIGGRVYEGKLYSSGTVEHMCLHPGGRPCYCGRRGCVEAYCSAGALEAQAGMPLPEFFRRLRAGGGPERALWRDYLQELALAIDNARMVVRSDVLLGGHLQAYMTPEDLALLRTGVLEQTFFPVDDLKLRRSQCGEKATAIGAGLLYIRQFLQEV